MVGMEYCRRRGLPLPQGWGEPAAHEGIIRKDRRGLRPEVCGQYRGELLVDAAQLDIVEHATDSVRNPDGNLPEDDDAKARALRYIITGDPYGASPEIVLVGHYRADRDLLSSSLPLIDEAMELDTPFIGNYQRVDGSFHSIALSPVSTGQLELYDPWDGFRERFSKAQIFQSGFLTNQGMGVVRWFQYIRPLPHNTGEVRNDDSSDHP